METGMTSGLAEACEALVIADDAEGVIVEVDGDDEAQGFLDFRYSAVGRVVTDRTIKLVVFRDVMAKAWRPVRGVNIRELGSNRFLFTFFHEKDIARVLNEGPWTFDQNLVLLRRLENGDDPRSLELSLATFWIQVHSLPLGFMSERVAKIIGNFVGSFVAADPRNFEGGVKSFMRVRVTVDVSKPLKKRMKMKRPGGEWFWVDFRYERLPSFCFSCGVIGHADKFCPVSIDLPDAGGEKPYGVWLRAGGRRGVAVPVNKWLVLDSPAGMGGGARGNFETVTNDEHLLSGNNAAVSGERGTGKAVHESEGRDMNAALNDNDGVVRDMNAALNDNDGVVIFEQKRRRVGDESEEGVTKANWASPMMVEENSFEEVGSGSQAHRVQ
ncbi:uncharacterized protein LOC115999574 [Ipomoea triloba]|uniref:uncharacterized protein LOC115999574 n=1 Tax=Ipomoea triloba TaxID=35885 RepID=UPI00125D2410|nr:uncharacterized protein LOC115999574 [Ipomoea triloba]